MAEQLTLPSSQRAIWRSRRVAVFLPVAVFFALSWRYLQLGHLDPSHSVFGDTGDGFFNLWILEHLYQNVFRGWSALTDTGIFYPETGTLWWSDNLIALSPPYLIARASGCSVLESGTWANVFWSGMMFWGAAWLFSEIRKTVMESVPTLGTVAGTGCFWLAVIAALIPARLYGLQHFQSHALVFWVALVAGVLRFLRTRSTRVLVGVSASWGCCMASAPYYAVLGIFPLGLCGLTLLTDSEMDWMRFWKRQVPWAGLVLIPVLPIIGSYLQVETREFSEAELLRTSWTWAHWLPPVHGARPHGFPGLWWIPLGFLVSVGLFRSKVWRCFGMISFRWTGWLGGGLLLTLLKVKELYPVTAWLRLGMGVAMVILWVVALRKNGSAASRVIFFLFLLAVGVIGTAMGPGTFFGDHAFDPSVWGVSAHLIPGFRGMRELVRFAPAGSLLMLCFGYALLLWCRPRCGVVFASVSLGLVVLTGVVDPWRPVVKRETVSPVQLTEVQREFFASLQGVMVEVPAAPFHRNPEAMLRWQPFPDIRLVNGYSGTCSSTFRDVISAENHHGRGSPEQIHAAQAAGADWMLIRRAWLGDRDERALAEQYPVRYQDDEMLLIRIGTENRKDSDPQ